MSEYSTTGSTSAALARVTAERDQARALLAKYLTNGIDHALAQMDNHVRAGDAWFCEACGDFGPKPGAFDNHPCGPPEPIPVRVTITRRTAG